MLKYLAEGEAARAGISYSVTTLLGCARRYHLQQRVDYYEHPDEAVARFVGDAVHAYVDALLRPERAYVGETRIFAQVPDEEGRPFLLSGQADQRWFRRKVVDLKTTRAIPPVPWSSHVAQVNAYAWMLGHGWDEHGAPLRQHITQGAVIYLSPNQQKVVAVPVPIWEPERTVELLQRHIAIHRRVEETGEYPELLPAVITRRKDGSHMVKRDTRCGWCPVRFECDQMAKAVSGLNPNEAAYWEQVRPLP
jgi:hypothetical protein